MKKTLIILSLCVVINCYADSPQIYSSDGTYLGNLNTNQYDPNSISNQYGRYGSQYSPDSINNQYGKYGSPYSADSANNQYGNNSSGIVGSWSSGNE